jgi:2-oxo-4-hydroxy-4-carboxy-5-ureidoimidazoline decarboxylase
MTVVAASDGSCPNGAGCTSDSPLLTVSELLAESPGTVIDTLKGIYEHSAWVAELFVQDTDSMSQIYTVSDLASRLKGIVDNASPERKMTLLNAHPDLCEKVEKMKLLTLESQVEQSKAGLQSMVGVELETFKQNNASYKERFGFPFILAVRNASKNTVLSALEGRLPNSPQQEFVTALEQVHKIAWMRLLEKVNTDDAAGFLTCHVLVSSTCFCDCQGPFYYRLKKNIG